MPLLPQSQSNRNTLDADTTGGADSPLAAIQWMRLLQVFIDGAICAAGLAAAFLIRFDGKLSPVFLHQLVTFVPVLVPLRLFSNWICGVYRRLWRYTGLTETVELAVSIVSVTTILMIFRALGKLPVDGQQLSYGVILTEPAIVFLLLCAARVTRRMQTEHRQRRHWRQPLRRRALVVGAGDAGQLVVRELSHRLEVGVDVVGFVDDDPLKVRKRIGNLTVFGTTANLAALIENLVVDQVIIAIPSAPPAEIRRIVDVCKASEVETRILPGFFELIDGRVSISQLREVSLGDLLGREPVDLDNASIADYIEGKRVLVTGAGGSIGSELCRQIMRFEPEELILVGRGENSIFMIHEELKKRPEPVKLRLVIADIRDRQRMSHVFARFRPHVVFHAAAHKHVPLMELNVSEAVTNNIAGTQAVATLSEEFGVQRFVLVSSDKAVNPTSVMGATKRIAEMVIQDMAARGAQTKFVAVRFGNVLDSRGSVLPIWREQIARGGPVTVTDPEATRYFMLIPEAVQLILQAAAIGSAGDIFVLDMGKPIKILDLARDLIKLSGLRPGQDIEIQFVGLRKGEKLYEELLTAEEGLTKTSYRKILVGKPQSIDHQRLTQELGTLFRSAGAEEEKTIRTCLNALVDGNLVEEAVR
ncbi:MAG TPA: nucleoside-diphosphate sugar epimerase/dehydratase [Candidatus Obscuribacterales bacterium]